MPSSFWKSATKATAPAAPLFSSPPSPAIATAPSPPSATSSTRAGGSLGENGSVAWQFESRGALSVPVGGQDEDEIALVAIEAGAEDIETSEDSVEIQTAPGDLETVRQALTEAGYTIEHADLSMVPTATIALEKGPAAQTLRLLDGLEELEDVQQVYSNADFDEELLAQYAG